MALLPWRKWYAGFTGQGDAKDVASVTQSITNTTISQVINEPTFLPSASTTRKGIVELATIAETITGTDGERAVTPASLAGKLATTAETNTGTDATRVITPDGLAGSIIGQKGIGIYVIAATTDITVADGHAYALVPAMFNGMNLIRAQATVITAGTTNATTIDIYNVTDSQDMLSTAISIASGGTVGTVGTINATYDDVATNDVLRIDVTTMSTTAPKGLLVILEFQLP